DNCYSSDYSDVVFFFSSRRRHTRFSRDWSSDVCSSDLQQVGMMKRAPAGRSGGHLRRHGGRKITEYRGGGGVERGRGWWFRAEKIGRASCRERVEVTGGGGEVKKKDER